MKLKEIWEYMKSEDGVIPALITAGAIIGGKLIEASGKKKDIEFQTEQLDIAKQEQRDIAKTQDILEARTREEQLEFLKSAYGPGGEAEIKAATFTPPDEAVFERMRELGLEDITEAGRFAQQAQAEQFAGRGLGTSSISIGAGQRLAQRTGRNIGRFETDMARQQFEAQSRFEQLQAAENARVQQAQAEMASQFASFIGPSVFETALAHTPFPSTVIS